MELADQGTCHGFRVVSLLPHPTLVPGPGKTLSVEEIPVRRFARGAPLLTFEERHGRLPMTIFESDGSFEVETASLGVFVVDPERSSIEVPAYADPIRREMLTLGTPFALLVHHEKDLAMHAAAFSPGEKAVIVTGRGGGGKSTLTAAALVRGWRILGDDLVRVASRSSPTVYQGPSVARIRNPSIGFVDLENVSVLARSAGKIHLLPKSVPTFRANQWPIAAILVLIPDPNGLSLKEIPASAAVPLLLKQAFYLPNDVAREECFVSVVSLADNVPVFRFGYPHSSDLLEDSLDLIAGITDA